MLGKLCCLLILLPFPAFSQDNMIENGELYSNVNESSTIEYNYLIEHIQLQKTNINYSTLNELINQLKLSEDIAQSIIKHIREYGHIKSVYELQQITELRYETLQTLLPYINFEERILDKIRTGAIKQIMKHEIITQFELKTNMSVGYNHNTSNHYLGNPLKEQLRYRAQISPNLLFGFSIKKDAGEMIQYAGYSWYIKIQSHKWIDELYLGNFQTQFAQGLCIGNALPAVKSLITSGLESTKEGIKIALTNNDAFASRGIALKTKLTKQCHYVSIFSYRILEANINQVNSSTTIGKINRSGVYRTTNEINKKGNLNVVDVNNRVYWQSNETQLGISQSSHLKRVRKNEALKTITHLIGIDFKSQINNIMIFGEICKELNTQQKAIVIGGLLRLDKFNDFGIHYRYFSNQFDGYNSNALSNNQCQNEKGLLINYNLKINSKTNCLLYVDQFFFPKSKYRVNGKSLGNEINLEVNHIKRDAFEMYLRYKSVMQQLNYSELNPISKLNTQRKQSLRWHCKTIINKQFEISHRFEYAVYSNNKDTNRQGYLTYIEIQNKLMKQLQINSRFSVFSVDDYNSRIYAYENDLSGTFNMQSWQNKGFSYFLILRYHVNKNFEIKTKFAGVRYFNIQTIGSGLDLIHSNRLHEIKIELKYQL